MATKLYLQSAVSDVNPGAEDERLLALAAGSSAVDTDSVATVNGPTAGVQLTLGTVAACWISNKLKGVSIGANLITFNLWGRENNMSANAGFDVLVQRCDSAGAVIDQICRSEFGTELAVNASANAVNNWTATATARTIADNERIKVTVFLNDAGGTMATGYTGTMGYSGGTGAANGDTYISFTETIEEMPPPLPKRVPVKQVAVQTASVW